MPHTFQRGTACLTPPRGKPHTSGLAPPRGEPHASHLHEENHTSPGRKPVAQRCQAEAELLNILSKLLSVRLPRQEGEATQRDSYQDGSMCYQSIDASQVTLAIGYNMAGATKATLYIDRSRHCHHKIDQSTSSAVTKYSTEMTNSG